MAEDRVAAELIQRGNKAWSGRALWDEVWQELAEQYYPQRADFTQPLEWGRNYAENLFDDAPVVLRRDLANSVSAMLRPRARRWFKPTVRDEAMLEQDAVAKWFDHAATIQWRWMYEPKANFVRAAKETDHDFVTFGNAVLGRDERRTKDGLIYTSYHLRDCVWWENAEREIDTLHRKVTMTARQIKQKFGKATLHEEILDACYKDPGKEFEVRHIMMPVDDYGLIEGAKVRRGMRQFPFVSIYLDVKHAEMISSEGSFEFRYIVARWHPISGSPYAVSPATFDTLPQARKIQVMARTTNEALEKSVDPPSKAALDQIIGSVNLTAGAVNWYNAQYDERGGPALELFDAVGKNALLALQALDAERARLADGTYVSKLNLPESKYKDMTAFETAKRLEEYVRQAMPLVEPWEAGYSAPILDDGFAVLARHGAFPPPPKQLRGQDFEWAFINPLQETIERMKAETYSGLMGMIAAASEALMVAQQAGFPIDDFDIRKASRDAARGISAPETWLVERKQADEAKAMKDQIAGLQQTIAGLQAAGEAAGAAGEGVTKVKEAIVGPQSLA